MKNQLRSLIILLVLLQLTSSRINGQTTFYNAPQGIKGENLTSFNSRETIISDELVKLNSISSRQHPEFGRNPYNTTCEDCFEIIDKRSANTRYFVKNGSNGSKFYSQASFNDLHYKNIAGEWLTIDPLLTKTATEGVFTALQQSNPTTLNLVDGYTSIQMWDKKIFTFNSNIRIYSTDNIVEPVKGKKINITDYTVGENGAEIINAFSGINQQLIFRKSSVKSNYLLNDLSSVDASKQFFIIEDQFILPEGYTLKLDEFEGIKNDAGGWYGELLIENENGLEMARFLRPIIFDSGEGYSAEGELMENNSAYYISQNGSNCVVKIAVQTKWLTDANRVFPLIIDPTVFGTTISWAGTFGSDDAPNWCTMTLNAPTPPNATLTGSRIDVVVAATGAICPPACRMNDVQLQFFTTCDYSPHPLGVWVCAGCNFFGTWTTWVDDPTTADLIECFTPTCTSTDIPFNVNINQFNCVTAGTCVTSCVYLMEFEVTLEGQTVEVTAQAEGANAYTVVDCTDQSGWLSPTTPNYGVPAYTYSWAPMGYTDPSVYVTFPLGTTVYTLTITDACGNVATDAVTVTNPCLLLPLSILDLSGYHSEGKNYLNWTISPESNPRFIVERSITGYDFKVVGETISPSIPGATQFTFNEVSPATNIVYYRIKQLDVSGEWRYSDVIAVKTGIINSYEIQSNFVDHDSNMLTMIISSASTEVAALDIFDITGKLVLSQNASINEGVSTLKLKLPELSAGTYLVKMRLAGTEMGSKFIY